MALLAATTGMGWPEALVAIVSGLVTAALTLVPMILRHRKEVRAREEAELERDVVVEGVERAGDTTTKAVIRKTAIERGAASLTGTVERVTKRMAPMLLLALPLFALGCCTLDHEHLAADAEHRRARMAAASKLPDAKLPAEKVRDVFADEADWLEALRSRAGGAPISSATRARGEARRAARAARGAQ